MLTRPAVSATRIVLLATTCPRCGAVRVTVGGRYVGTVNLRGPWQSRRWVALRPFSRRAGALVLRSVAGGRLVRIDAVALLRA